MTDLTVSVATPVAIWQRVDMSDLATMAGRAWYAYHCLPRNDEDKPPPVRRLEKKQGIANGTLKKVFTGERDPVGSTLAKVADALGVNEEWLLRGTGTPPTPTGYVPAPPGGKKPPRDAQDSNFPPAESAAYRRTDGKPVRYPNLEAALRFYAHKTPPRWQDATISAARDLALQSATDPDPERWTGILDALDKSISGVVETLNPQEVPLQPRAKKR